MDVKEMSPELKDAYLMYMEYKHNKNPESLTDDDLEKIDEILSKRFNGQTDDRIIRHLTYEVSTDKRLKQQFFMRLWAWVTFNVILFWDIGFGSVLSIGGIAWLVGGTIFVLTIWSVVGASLERVWIMMKWNFYVWRTIEYVSMYLISGIILNTIF